MRVQDVMSRAVQTVAAGAPAGDAWEQMTQRGIHHLVVVHDRKPVGVLSARDLGGAKGPALRRNRTVRELMTAPPVTVAPTATVRKAANLMRGRALGSLVVVDGGRVVGMVTVSDLLELLGRGIDKPTPTAARAALRHRVPHRHRDASAGAW